MGPDVSKQSNVFFFKG